MKKLVLLLTVILIALCLTSCGEEKTANGFDYTVNSDGKTCTITGIDSSLPEWLEWLEDIDLVHEDRNYSSNLTIPKYLNGYTVTSIGEDAFYDCDSLTSVTIPDSVTSIGEDAFYDCDSLTSVTIPDSVTSIGNYAFSVCTSLTSVIIPDSVTSIGDLAFSYCYSLTSVTISDSVTSIGDWAFSYCYSLTSVTIPDSVTSIGDLAFYDCDSLTSVTIPDSVTSIGNWAFSRCDSLTSITVDENNQDYKSIDGNLYSKDESILMQYAIGKKDTHFAIPNSVTSIGDDAFSDCTSLTSVIIPDSVTSIGEDAFYDCDSLISITIPNGVTSIGDDAFWSCDNLYIIYNNGNVDLSLGAKSNGYIARNAKVIVNKDGISYADDGNKYILTDDGFLFKYKQGEYTLIAYDGRESKVTLPEKINGSSYSLECVKGLTEVIIPDGVTNIEANSFGDSLRSITIPASVINIDAEAFVDCTRLQNIKVSEENAAYKSIDGNLYTKDGKILVKYSSRRAEKQFVIPNEMTEININYPDDFYYIESVVIHKGVTNIADSAFSGCENLEYVYFTGTQEEWKNIVFGEHNDNLINAIIVYEYIPE